MTSLIDDETATRYWSERDTAPEVERESRNAALIDWAKAKKADQFRAEQQQAESAYTDLEGWWKENSAGHVFEKDEDRLEVANRRFIANQFQQTPDQQGRYYPTYRDEYLQKTFGKSGLSETDTFNLIRDSLSARKVTEDALRELPGALAKGMFSKVAEGKTLDETDSWFLFQDWKDRHADKLGKLPEGWESAMLDRAVKLQARSETMMRDLAPESKRAFDTLMAFTRPEDAEALPEAGRADVENIAKEFAKLTPEDRQNIYSTLYYAAEADGAGMGKGFFEKVGEGIARGGVNIYNDAEMTAQDRQARQNISYFQSLLDKPEQQPDRMQTAESIQMQRDLAQKGVEENTQRLSELKALREIRQIADGTIDPIKTEMDGVMGEIVQGAYDFSQSAVYTGLAAVPYVGLPAVMGALTNSNYLRMLDTYPDMDADAALAISGAIAAPQAFIERFQGRALVGKSPMLNSLMKKMTDVRIPIAGRLAIGYGANVAYQTGQEFVQEAMPVAADQIAAAIREDMPEFDAEKAWGAYKEQMPEIFYSMLWGGLIGTGTSTFREFKRNGQFERSLGELEMVGITGEAAQDIAAEQDLDVANTKFREAWSNRTPEDIQAGIAKRAAQLEAASSQQDNPELPVRRIEENADGTLTHIIEKPDGTVLYRTNDSDAADTVYMQQSQRVTANDLLSNISTVTELRNQWLSEDPTNVAIEAEAMTAQQKLEKLQAAGNVAQIEELHRRIATSPYKDTPYDKINILGEATVEDLGEMVFRGVITLNKNSKPEDAREEIHHVAVRKALMKGSVTLDTLKGWLDATETALPDKFPGLVRDNENDIVESLARVQRAYEDGKINADEEMALPASFVDYIKRMLKAFKEVLQRAVALRGAFKQGILPGDYESFLAESVGLNQQTMVDTTRERVGGELTQGTFNYSVGQRVLTDTNPYPMEQKGKWWANEDFAQRGGQIVTMSPDEFLSQVRPLEVDEASRDNIDDLKNMMQSGRKLDPLAIYADGKEDGRHRAIAAKELGMDTIPVLDFRQPVSTDTNYSIGRSDEITGLPLNPNGTVTVYHGTTKDSAAEIQRTGILKSAGEPDVYFTTAKNGTGYGDGTVVGIEIDPKQLILDDEFPDGRRDFRVNVGKSKSLAVKLSQSAPNWHSSPDEFQKHWTDRGVAVENGRAYSPIVRDLLQRRAAGEDIPRSVIDQAINDNFPAQLVEPPKTESELPSRATIDDAINEGQRRDQIAKSKIQPGEAVTIRQDVPAMTRKRVGVVTIKSKAGNSYDAAARISDPQFILNEKKSLEIGMGGAKGPHIAIRGKWSSDQSMPADLNQWTQVGFNPDRHSFYYDRATMKQVVGGSEAYQIGNTVFVKDAQFGDGQISNISYSIASVEHFKNDKRFDKLVKDGRVVIGHDIEEFKGMHILLHSPDNAFAGTIKLTDGEEIQGKGGVYYPALYANKNYFWASTEATVMTTAKHLNEIGQKNGGKILMGLVSAPVEKLFSSTSMATGVVKFLNSLTSNPKAGLSKEDLNSMLVEASKVQFVKKGATPKKFSMTLAKGDGLEKNLSKVDALLEPTKSIFQVRKMFSESLADQLSKHLKTNPEASNYVGGILADAENKHAKSAIKRGTLSKASIMQGLGNLFTEPFLRDFQDHGNGKIYAVLEVDGMVDGVASKAHDSYPFTLVPRNKKSKVKLHVLNQAVDWQDVVGRETGEYTTPEERIFLMPTSGMSAKTLKVLGVRGGSKANPLNYSIASQSEIDRVNRALGGMNRGPDERLKVYERAKQKFSKLMAWNSDELAAMADTGSDETQIRRNQLLQGFGELDAILQVLPPEVRGRVGGYTVLANIAPMDVFKDGVKVSESKNMDGAIISAWMKEGQNIGQAGKQVSLPPGYTAKENLASKRADKALADFFRDRIKKIDTELEKVLVREYTEAITKAVKQSRPKAGDNGVRKSTLGAETQKFADMVQRATLLDDEATPKRMAEIEAALTNPDATAEDISALSEEWSILNTFGDLDNRSSETLAQGLDWLKGQLQMGREAWRIKEQARIDEQRARAAATIEWLGKGTAKKRNATKTKSELASDLANHYLLSHANFEQFVTAIFPPEIASRWAEKLRKADEASQTAEIRNRKGILDAVRAGAKAANMSTADALLWLKGDQKNAVAYLEGREVKDERIAIDLAQKIVTGEADRSKLTDADIETLRNELAALPADTQKEYVTIKRVIFRGEDVKLDMSRGKAMQYLLSWNQPDVQIKMRKEGWTDESAADLKALVNDPVSREVMAYAKELYGKGAGIVNPVYSRMFGMNMPQVKNYAPTRFLNAKDSKDIGLDGSATATGTTPGFAKSRVTHSAKIAPEDALTVMQGHIAQQAHWVHFAELAREFRAILSNPEVRESIKQTQGESVLKDAELWADQMEQRGGNKARESTWMNTILGTVLSGKAISSLGFNLKTLAMQLENTIRFGLALDMKQIVSALSNPSAIVEDIQTVWDSPAIQNRLEGGATAEARFLFSRYAGKPNFAAKIAEASMTPINWLDSAGTSISSAIVYRANLNDALASGMPENLAKQAALNAASEAIYRFAQPVSFGQKSIMENNGNVLAKTFFLFMSDPRLKTAILADAARGLATGRGNASEHIRRIVAVELMALVSHVISSAFKDAFSDDDDEEIWNLGGFAKAILLAPLQGFFFAGTVGELAISKLTGQKFFSSTQNPLLTNMEQAIRAGTNMEDAINFDDPEAMFKEWNNIFRSMALSPTMAAPAVLLNMVKPALGLYQNATTED